MNAILICALCVPEYPIEISAEEIVRCVAQLGQNMKHKIFIFVLPNCTKRLEDLNPSLFSSCSLIVLFTSALSHAQISKMIHIFHNMSKNSIFSPLFSETDQDGALLLLSNIKPGIVGRVEKAKEVVMSSRSLDVEPCRSQDEDMAVTSSGATPSGNRLTIPFTQERRSLSLNDAPMIAERQQESRPLDLSAPNTTDNSMWNGAVHPNRNLSRTKFHFKQRSFEMSKKPPRLGSGGGPGAGGGGGLLRKAQRQYAVDNGSDEDEETSIPMPVLPQQTRWDLKVNASVFFSPLFPHFHWSLLGSTHKFGVHVCLYKLLWKKLACTLQSFKHTMRVLGYVCCNDSLFKWFEWLLVWYPVTEVIVFR